ALEVPRPEFTAEDARQSRDIDARRTLGAVGIHLGHIRREHEIAARGSQHSLVLLGSAWIVSEILVGAELHGIDENTRDEPLAVPPGHLYQADMARMEVAHRRDEGNPQAFAMPCAHSPAYRGNAADCVHTGAQNSCSGAGYSPLRTALT